MKKENSSIINLLNKGLHSENISISDEYNKLLDEKINYERQLINKFTPELCELFKSYQNVIDEILINDSDDYFAYGFKHGVLLGLEIASPD